MLKFNQFIRESWDAKEPYSEYALKQNIDNILNIARDEDYILTDITPTHSSYASAWDIAQHSNMVVDDMDSFVEMIKDINDRIFTQYEGDTVLWVWEKSQRSDEWVMGPDIPLEEWSSFLDKHEAHIQKDLIGIKSARIHIKR